eukprot:803039_1
MILRNTSTVYTKHTRVSIDTTLSQAQFPFSLQIHSYLNSYKDDCLRSWVDDTVPIIESGPKGQNVFTTDMQNKLHAAGLSVPIDNLPVHFVRRLSQDIVLLESTRLGLRRHGEAVFSRFTQFVDGFLWKSSNDAHALKARKHRKNVYDHPGSLEIDPEESSSESDVSFLFIPDSDCSSGHDADEKEKEDEEEEDEVEKHTVQIHEVYASLWANEKIILQCIDVLSILKESPIRLAAINREWDRHGSFGTCLEVIMGRLLDELQEILILASDIGLKTRVEYLYSTSQSFEDILNFLTTFQFRIQDRIGLRKKWNVIRLSMLCVSACGGGIRGAFINDLKNRFGNHRFDNLQKLGGLIQLISDALRNNLKNTRETNNEILQWFCQNYIR